MDIYQDLVEAGKELLDAYESVRDVRKKQQKHKRGKLMDLLKTLEKELSSVGMDARGNDMQVLPELEDDSDGLDDT